MAIAATVVRIEGPATAGDGLLELAHALRSVRDPLVPFYGPDGKVASTAEDIRRLLQTEFIYPTLWNATFEAMVRDGLRLFFEVGPGDMLTKMTRWIDRSVACRPAGSLLAIRAVGAAFRE